jgi:anti-sigma B factor antagonist
MIHERKSGKVVILSVERSLKGVGEAALKDRLDALVHEGHLDILVDLKACGYLDSSEIGRLIRCHLSVRKAGGRVRLCNLSPRILSLMKMTRLDTVMDLFGTEAQALAAINGEARADGASAQANGTEHMA